MNGLTHYLRRFVRWPCEFLFGYLPPLFGNPVPPDLRVFEAQADDAQHDERPAFGQARVPHWHTRPARLDEALERQ